MKLFSLYRDQLLGLSIILIIIFHYFEDYLNLENDDFITITAKIYNHFIGSIGVEFFLFLSGMGLYYSLSKKFDIISFYKKRMTRVLIPYLIYGFFFWIIKDILIEERGFADFLFDYSLLSFWIYGTKNLWYIAYIIVLYLITPFIYCYLYKKSGNSNFRIITILVFVIALCIIVCNFFSTVYANIEIGITRTIVFIFGLYFGRAISDQKSLPVLFFAFGFVIKAIVIVIDYFDLFYHKTNMINRFTNGLYSISLLFLIALICSFIKIDLLNMFLLKCGEYSLELYMTHVTVRSVFIICGYPTSNILNYMFCIAISIVLSIALHKLTETLLYKNKNKKGNI